MIVKKINEVQTYTQRRWLAPYIHFCIEMRKKAKNEFEKQFWKDKMNIVFGKLKENVRGRLNMKLATNRGGESNKQDRTYEKWLSDPLFEDAICWGENLTDVLSKE